jgi:hypothetical protein
MRHLYLRRRNFRDIKRDLGIVRQGPQSLGITWQLQQQQGVGGCAAVTRNLQPPRQLTLLWPTRSVAPAPPMEDGQGRQQQQQGAGGRRRA